MEDAELLTKWQRKNKEYKQRHELTAHRESDTLARLKKFQAILHQKQTAPPVAPAKAVVPDVAEPDKTAVEVSFSTELLRVLTGDTHETGETCNNRSVQVA